MPALEIILDETAETAPTADYTVIATEIEFLRGDTDGAQLWVRGASVCEYVRAVCQARKINFREIVSPRVRLRSIVGDVADKISLPLLNRSLEILEREKPKTVADLLFHLTGDEFWLAPVSTEHAAGFLTIDLADEMLDLVETQRKTWLQSDQAGKLKEIYASDFAERENLLSKWFFDGTTRKKLGEFPLPISDKYAPDLLEKIEQTLRETEGAAVADFPKNTPNKKLYARAVEDYFTHHPQRLTADRLAIVSPLLKAVERSRLEKLLPQNAVAPLAADAGFQTALDWATEVYLPFRRRSQTAEHCAETDKLADSFGDWILENYPKMAFGDYENSLLNLRTFYTVKKLLEQNYWVLWTVVDGLNYANHQKLLQLVGEKSANLRVAENRAVFAVLPTITEKAKYGLTSGKFPSENTKRDWNHKNNFFANFPDGVYAGNSDEDRLLDGLKRDQPIVCYWNYTEIDNCYHQRKTSTFIENKVDSFLRGMAGSINQLVSMSKNMNRVAVVICSDHGQMTTHCRQSNFELGDRHAHGRTALDAAGTIFGGSNSAYIKSEDGETVYLNPTSFRLSEPTTVALGATYFVDLKADSETGAIGVHGGLYPEEAVVGLAVLMRDPAHRKLTATVGGNGETGKPGALILTVDNPNPVTVNPLSITVENLRVGEQGELLLAKIAAKDIGKFELPIEKFPAPTSGEIFEIKGVLRYEFDDGTQDECDVTGRLLCRSLYAAKNPSLLDRFKK